MTPAQRSPDLHVLLAKLADETLLPEEHAQLQDRLKKDPLARQSYYAFMDMESGLREWAHSNTNTPLLSFPTTKKANWTSWFNFGNPYIAASMLAAVCLLAMALSAWGTLVFLGPAPPVARQPAPINDSRPHEQPLQKTYVATLRGMVDCQWEDGETRASGQRLKTGLVALKSGLAELRFDSGTFVSLQGPCRFQLVSTDQAGIMSGKAVIRVSEIADTFVLDTPCSTIVDEGTEYGVDVISRQEIEVCVFEGNVLWMVDSDKAEEPAPVRILQGQARAFSADNLHQGREIPFEKHSYIREIKTPAPTARPEEALIAREGFDYVQSQWKFAKGGQGWAGSWTLGEKMTLPADGKIIEATSPPPFGLSSENGSGQLNIGNAGRAWRRLKTPLSLDKNAVYFVSFLLTKNKDSADKEEKTNFNFELGAKMMPKHPRGGRKGRHRPMMGPPSRRRGSGISFGVTSDNFQYIRQRGENVQSAPPLVAGKTYLFVAKITASSDSPDQSFLRIYGPGEKIDVSEPQIWSATGPQVTSSRPLESILISTGADADYNLSQIFIGTTWQSVTSAY